MARAKEKDVLRVGRQIFDAMKGQKPSVFDKDWWSGKVMDLSMKDDAFKVEMFRFVDVFPTLKTPVQVAEHIQEYFCRPEQDFPAMFQFGLSRVAPDGMIARKAAELIAGQMTGMAQKFIAGTTAAEAMGALRKIWDSDLAFTLDLLGEATVSEAEAQTYVARYNEILDTLVAQTASWPAKPLLEQASWGSVPRVNVSVKVSSLYSQIDPIDFQSSIDAVKERLRPLFRKAKAAGALINLDMEQYELKDLTIALFKSLLDEPEFANFDGAGIAIQAYLRDAPHDVEDLCKWAKKRGTPVTVRLIKGAYWDFESIHAEQESWRNPVWTQKWETDRCYEQCAEILLDHHKYIRTAIGSHNVRSIAHAIVYAQSCKVSTNDLEFQMLFGMAEPMKAALARMGFRVREYVPIGEMIPGMAYLVRRLLENTSNESWLRHSFADGMAIEALLAQPQAPAGQKESSGLEHIQPMDPLTGFRNHPMLNFALLASRQQMAAAQARVQSQFGIRVPIVIGKDTLTTPDVIASVDPSSGRQLGEVSLADIALTDRAVDTARRAQPAWAATPAAARADILHKAAQILARQRHDLAAWMVFEVGKNWREADADLCEAIDFCNYYALQMKQLGHTKRLGNVAGELNVMFQRPRGVAAVIGPWNFPLAILAGMTVAAAVTGNTVVVKPAEQSSIIAYKLIEVLREAGFPPGVINFLPGVGEVVGKRLVDHPDVDVIAFTGSMEVGLQILAAAGQVRPGQLQPKKVVCEMGGKNAIIVDADADLDEALKGVIGSAFAFQGQKCSACSRVIVHDSCYDEFRERLMEATRSLEVGDASNPAFAIGPVVDAESKAKIEAYIEIGKQEGKLLVQREAPRVGTFVGPVVFEDIAPDARLAQEEIFGPVLALMRAPDFDTALSIANATRFALTGGIYSRSPLNIAKAYAGFDVGNLYVNRKCTGALVFRQPFGGYKMSGVGTKAGSPDYLAHFMVPRAVSENTMRRGFAPTE